MATARSRVSTRWIGADGARGASACAGAPDRPRANVTRARCTGTLPLTLPEVQDHDDRVLLILGVVLGPHAHGTEGESAVEALSGNIGATDLEGDASADLAPSEVDHVGQHARGVSGA